MNMIEELYVLDADFNEIGVISNYQSIIWLRSTTEPGLFEVYLGADYFDLATQAAYIVRSDECNDLGVVKNYELDKQKSTVTIKGKLGEILLYNEVISPMVTKSGKPQTVMKYIFQTYYQNNHPEMLVHPDYPADSGASSTASKIGAEVGDYLYEYGKADGLWPRVEYDYENNKLYFTILSGLDRTEEQNENTLAVFSLEERTAMLPVYTYDVSDYKNIVIVAGAGEGSSRIILTIDQRASTDEERRVLFVDARDLQIEENETTESYKERLRKRGLEKLSECTVVETLEAEAGENEGLVYRTDYDLGDLCTYKDEETGITVDERITEITEFFENNTVTIELTFGQQKKTIIEKIRKGVA